MKQKMQIFLEGENRTLNSVSQPNKWDSVEILYTLEISEYKLRLKEYFEDHKVNSVGE